MLALLGRLRALISRFVEIDNAPDNGNRDLAFPLRLPGGVDHVPPDAGKQEGFGLGSASLSFFCSASGRPRRIQVERAVGADRAEGFQYNHGRGAFLVEVCSRIAIRIFLPVSGPMEDCGLISEPAILNGQSNARG